MYIMRLDDACEKMNVENWEKIERLLDKYNIKPIVGIIPKCRDKDMDKYPYNDKFWSKVKSWETKKWIIALHGYEHIFHTKNGGINPINNYSEFAGVPLEEQKKKIEKGIKIMEKNGIAPKVFFAPAHTFDRNTLLALKAKSNIRIISDTIAHDKYEDEEITFIPQQSGRVRNLPFKIVTFCYHPNLMSDKDFSELENFLKKNRIKFGQVPLEKSGRKITFIDKILRKIYFFRRKGN